MESGLWVRTVAVSIRGEEGMTGDELDEGDASAIALEERFDALVVDVTDLWTKTICSRATRQN